MHLAVSIVRDPALAEDLSQTTFVKVWQALPKFDGRAALSTWLYTIARNTCLTAVERERRIVPLEDFAEVADDDGDPMVFGTAQAGVETAGQAAAEYDVAKLLEQLPEPYRRVVVLFYLEDRSCEEVGELLSMPTGTVKALLHRGRKRLAALAGESRRPNHEPHQTMKSKPGWNVRSRTRCACRNSMAVSMPPSGRASKSASRGSPAALRAHRALALVVREQCHRLVRGDRAGRGPSAASLSGVEVEVAPAGCAGIGRASMTMMIGWAELRSPGRAPLLISLPQASAAASL